MGHYQHNFLRLLEHGSFERRPAGWRFGTKTISNAVVARLIASGRAVVDGDLLRLVRLEAAE